MKRAFAFAGIIRIAMVLALAGVAAALALLARAPASAEDGAATPDGDVSVPAPTNHDWEFTIAPYLWLSNVDADISFRDVSAHVDPSLWDLISDLEFGFMGTFDVHHRPSRLSFTVDAFWMQLSQETDAGPVQVGAGPFTFQSPGLQKQVGPVIIDTPRGPLVLGPFDVDTGGVRPDVPRVDFPVGPFEVEETMTSSAVRASFAYRVLDRPLASLFAREAKDDPRRLRADLYAGARYWYLKSRTQVKYPRIRVPGLTIHPSLVAYPQFELSDLTVPGVTFGGADIDEEESGWWVDPIVGARAEADLCGRLGLIINGNLGGFGIGSASKFSWEAQGLLTWRLGEHWTAAGGYRALWVDRQKGDLEVELLMHGAVLGIIYRFP